MGKKINDSGIKNNLKKNIFGFVYERYLYWRYAAKAVSVLPGPGKMWVGFWKYFEEVKEVSDSKPNYVPTQKCFWLRLLQDISREDLPWNLSQYCLDREKYYLEKEKIDDLFSSVLNTL